MRVTKNIILLGQTIFQVSSYLFWLLFTSVILKLEIANFYYAYTV